MSEPHSNDGPQFPQQPHHREGYGSESGQVPGSPWHTSDTQALPQQGHHPTQPIPTQGAGPEYPHGYGYPQSGPAGSEPQYAAADNSPHGGATAAKTGRTFSSGVLITGMLLAGLIGAGAAVGTEALTGSGGGTTTAHAPILINDKDSVNAVAGAAQKISPSVVTIAASAGNESGAGSGVVLDDQGHILTNTHVVTLDGATAIAALEVRADDGSVRTAKIVGTDPESDLAVIKVDPSGLTPAAFGDSDKLNVGQQAIAVGAPLGLSGTVTNGIISTLNRTIAVASSAAPEAAPESEQSSPAPSSGSNDFFFNFPGNGEQKQQANSSVYLNVIQTDAAINPGNSGGPLVNTNGEVIGINVAIASAGNSASGESGGTGNIGVGFSIPSNTAKRVADELIKTGKATHGYLGASVSAHTPNGTQSGQFSDGALVRSVQNGSPADEAGLRANDVVIKVDETVIQDADTLTAAVRQQAAGTEVELTYLRGGDEHTTKVTLGNAADQK